MARPIESIRHASDREEHVQTFLLKLSNHTEELDAFLSLISALHEAGMLQLVEQTVQARNALLKHLIEQLNTEEGRRLLTNVINLIGWLSTEEATRLIRMIGVVAQTLPAFPDALGKDTALSHFKAAQEEVASSKIDSPKHSIEAEQKKSNKKHAYSWSMLIRTFADPEVRAGIIAFLEIARVFGKQPSDSPAHEQPSH